MSIQAQLTVYFEEPFWIGIYEIKTHKQQWLCKITYGKEPTDPEIYQSLLTHYHNFNFISHKDKMTDVVSNINPKRKQRLVNKLMKQPISSTKAQLILKEEFEKIHQEKRVMSKQRNEEQKAQLYELKKQKRKEKHKGH